MNEEIIIMVNPVSWLMVPNCIPVWIDTPLWKVLHGLSPNLAMRIRYTCRAIIKKPEKRVRNFIKNDFVFMLPPTQD